MVPTTLFPSMQNIWASSAAIGGTDAATEATPEEDGLFAEFFRIYLPKDERNRYGPPIPWLKAAADMKERKPVLDNALKALTTNRVAAARSDAALADEGRAYLGEALRLLNQIIDEETPWDDQGLAAVRCLMIYELFESTTSSVVGWGSHHKGLVRLVTMRGPDSFQSEFSKWLLLDIKGVNVSIA